MNQGSAPQQQVASTLNFIGGEFVAAASGRSFENRSAADGGLLADDAEADPRVAPVEVGERFGERRAAGRDTVLVPGVVGEIRRNEDVHAPSSAASTLLT